MVTNFKCRRLSCKVSEQYSVYPGWYRVVMNKSFPQLNIIQFHMSVVCIALYKGNSKISVTQSVQMAADLNLPASAVIGFVYDFRPPMFVYHHVCKCVHFLQHSSGSRFESR